ncbi:ppx/GppA phosphatase family domain-containing protein [Ditylenchus destructor]|uniref:Ppx/GppA phosphatase family domain-containing protein n=1 Tax=Ditylenchus destructor TaxID=166010 RepID=A0AAD4QSL5_9BILA|nr:ppx/GppA phosphatase family domain-containing protein [Ditylenchus destructor]
MAGLGRSLTETGAIDEAALTMATTALAPLRQPGARDGGRFDPHRRYRCGARGVERRPADRDRAIAGAGGRAAFGRSRGIGGGYGVPPGIPDADGIVGDLGGGSLELVRVVAGTVTDRVSFPLGVLRIGAIPQKGEGDARPDGRQAAERCRRKTGRGAGLPFYLVGGSWRALARLDMHLTGYPLPVITNMRCPRRGARGVQRTIQQLGRGKIRAVPNLSSGRVATMEDAAALLGVLIRHLGSRETVASAFGLREGLLWGGLSSEQRLEDPLRGIDARGRAPAGAGAVHLAGRRVRIAAADRSARQPRRSGAREAPANVVAVIDFDVESIRREKSIVTAGPAGSRGVACTGTALRILDDAGPRIPTDEALNGTRAAGGPGPGGSGWGRMRRP